jgi:hypothetical protein
MTARSTDAESPAGTLVAERYEVRRQLGQGAFGRTFEAHDRGENRLVALKLLDRRGAGDWKAYELFEREAAVLRSLRHHGVPQMYELVKDQWEGAPAAFLVMEFVEGTSLAQIVDEPRQLDPAQALDVFLELLGVLEYLHGRVPPILHRDIKPSNIIIRPDGTPALVDFGSVRRVFMGPDEGGSTVAGTYGYMPYEQYMGQASAASDLYSLGATFLHVTTGRPPREFMTPEGRIEVPDTLPGDTRLRPIIARLLRPSPAERFSTARDVRKTLLSSVALETARPDLPVRAVDAMSLGPAPRELTGNAAAQFERVRYTMWELMDTSAKPGDDVGIGDLFWVAFFSVVTAGILPAVFGSMARARTRRLRRFFRAGVPAMAEIVKIELEKIPFDSKLARVSYQFEADGFLRRDADQVLPSRAQRWQPGDRVQVLYLPTEDYDSVIISAS